MRPGLGRRTRSPALGQTWHPPFSPQGSEDSLGLHLRGHLPGPRQRSGSGPAPLHDCGHDLAPEGDFAGGHTRGACLLLVDQAGWHQSKNLVVPANITLVPLPSKAPELNPVENIWQFMRENWISNRIFASYSDILDHCCEAWNKLTDRPWLIMSIGLRDWAHRF